MAQSTPMARFSALNDMSEWFPRLAERIPDMVPKTELIAADAVALLREMEQQGGPEFTRVMTAIRQAAERLGASPHVGGAGRPVFLRTGRTAGKHGWARTCFLREATEAAVARHMVALIEYSEMVDLIGLPCNTWAVREYLPPPPGTPVSARFEGMPVRREFRCFWRRGEILCIHPYWPPDALEPDLREQVSAVTNAPLDPHNERLVRGLVELVGQSFMEPDGWSIDVLETDRGWMITDMAVMPCSFHWKGCPNAPED